MGRRFTAERINQRWFADGTEIPTGEGKLYLHSVLDIRSRRVVGFTLAEHHDAAAAYAALAMAVAVRGGQVAGVLLHTDGGGEEYTAASFRAACARLGVVQSMGRPGSALDNAAIESWHSTLTFELLRRQRFATKNQTRRQVATWVEEYNRERRHSALGMRAPVEFERDELSDRSTAASLPPSSPLSRPSPSGGLRPALTTAAGGEAPAASEQPKENVREARSA